MDLLLSSGFLAFARHLGVFDALVARGRTPDAVVGTSSGALVGALYLAGHDLDVIAGELSSRSPLSMCSPVWNPWRGFFSTRRVQARLAELLPARIEDLPCPFAVGVCDESGEHRLLTEGALPAAVMASCAMPVIFQPIAVDGRRFHDGGAGDRLGADAWRRWRPNRTGIAHWVDRTAGKDVEADLSGLTVIRTPRSGAKLWSLGDFAGQREEARRIAGAVLEEL